MQVLRDLFKLERSDVCVRKARFISHTVYIDRLNSYI